MHNHRVTLRLQPDPTSSLPPRRQRRALHSTAHIDIVLTRCPAHSRLPYIMSTRPHTSPASGGARASRSANSALRIPGAARIVLARCPALLQLAVPNTGDTVIRTSRSSPHGFVTPYVPAGPRTPPSQSACIYHRQQFVVLLHIGPALAGHSLVAVPALASRPRSEPARQRIIGGNTNVRVRPYVANTSSRNIGGTSAGMFTSASRMYSSLADLRYISR